MAFDHTILITAPGGNIGRELVPLLLGENNKLVLLTSNAERLHSTLEDHSSAPNVAVEEGNIKDPIWLQKIITDHSVDVVFLCLTGADELMTTLNFFGAMERAGCVKQLVYLSARGDFATPDGIKFLMRFCSAAHVLVKSTIEQKLVCAGYHWTTTILGPTLFMGNYLKSKKSMLEDGMIDWPVGEKGVSMVSTSDIALAAKNVIANPGKYNAKKISIGSREVYTASQMAALWSDAIGKEVKPYPEDEKGLLEWERQFAAKTGAGEHWARDLRLMFDTFIEVGFGMSEEEYREQVELLGKEPEDYAAWVKKTGQSWRE